MGISFGEYFLLFAKFLGQLRSLVLSMASGTGHVSGDGAIYWASEFMASVGNQGWTTAQSWGRFHD